MFYYSINLISVILFLKSFNFNLERYYYYIKINYMIFNVFSFYSFGL